MSASAPNPRIETHRVATPAGHPRNEKILTNVTAARIGIPKARHLMWLKDESTEDGSNLPKPDEMIQDLQNALELLTEVAQVVTKRPT